MGGCQEGGSKWEVGIVVNDNLVSRGFAIQIQVNWMNEDMKWPQ